MFQLAQNWWAIAVRGAIAILFGVLAIAMPGITLASLIILFGIFAVIDGVFAIVSAVRAARREERWGMFVLEGVASIIAGLIALFVPLAAALAFIFLFAAWAVVTGALEIAAAIRLRREIEGEWLLGLTGALSILLGIFVAAFPVPGLVGLVWMIGVYAIVIGIALLALAFRLRRLAHAPGATPAHP